MAAFGVHTGSCLLQKHSGRLGVKAHSFTPAGSRDSAKPNDKGNGENCWQHESMAKKNVFANIWHLSFIFGDNALPEDPKRMTAEHLIFPTS